MAFSERLGKATLNPFIPTISMLLVQCGDTSWSPLFILMFLFLHVRHSKTSFIQIGFSWPQVCDQSKNKGEDISEQKALSGSLPCSANILLEGLLALHPSSYQAPSWSCQSPVAQ